MKKPIRIGLPLWQKVLQTVSKEKQFSRPATSDDLKRIIKSLNDQGAEYLLIGGYALYTYGYHRATDDIDLLLPRGADKAKPVIKALLILEDRQSANLDPAWFDEGDTIRLADEVVVDLMFTACGETFESLRSCMKQIHIDGIPVKTLTLEGLLKTKQTVREKDLMDRQILEYAIDQSKRNE